MEDFAFIITPMSTFEALHASLSLLLHNAFGFFHANQISPKPCSIFQSLQLYISGKFCITEDEKSFCCLAKQHTLQ